MDDRTIHFRSARCIFCRKDIDLLDDAVPDMMTTSALCFYMLNQAIAIDPQPTPVVECKGHCFQCWSRTTTYHWYHASCQTILFASYGKLQKPNLRDIQDFGLSTLAPSRSVAAKEEVPCEVIEEGLWSRHTKCILEHTFSQERIKRLPAEVRHMVELLIQDCAYLVVLGQTRRLMDTLRKGKNFPSVNTPICWSSSVYSWHTRLQNTSYLSRISNEPLESRPHRRLLHYGSHIQRVVLSKDDFGVTNIRFFDTCSSSVAQDGSPWYENLVIKEEDASDFKMIPVSDGLILRNVRSDRNEVQVVEWDTPNPPDMKDANVYSSVIGRPGRRRMQYHPLTETLSGLTVCCANGRMIGLHAHCLEVSSYSTFVDKVQSWFSLQDLLWIYVPIEKGERILSVWIRRFKNLGGTASRPCVIISTTHSKLYTFGPYVSASYESDFSFHSIEGETDGLVSGLFHNAVETSRDSVSCFGVSYDAHTTKRTAFLPKLLSFVDTPPSSGGPLDWYMSKATLHGCSGLRFCIDTRTQPPRYMGLLVCYGYGSQEALGQFRWDLTVTGMILLDRAQYHNDIIEGKHHISWRLSDVKSDFQSGTCWQALSPIHTLFWWFGQKGEQLRAVNPDKGV